MPWENGEYTPPKYKLSEAGRDFTTTQSYKPDEPAKTYICECGNDRLQVGSAHYLTVIKCPDCKWEDVIHDG